MSKVSLTVPGNVKMEARLTKEGKLPMVSWEKIIDHIDHVVKLVGPDHVGLGSDFDDTSMPEGMEDCSKPLRITEALLGRGYSEDDIHKILEGNLLCVMEYSERICRERQQSNIESIVYEDEVPVVALR